MTRSYVCDRCGCAAQRGLTIDTSETWAVPAARSATEEVVLYAMGKTPPQPIPETDLCGECAWALRQWLAAKE